ncbi:MAG: CoA-binding protein [Calditrichia bacterium]
MKNNLSHVEEFMAVRRFAFVGVSREEKDFTRQLFTEFRNRGYEAVPVNPFTMTIAGQSCFASAAEISPGVSAALITTAPDQMPAAVADCLEAGINLIWILNKKGYEMLDSHTREILEAPSRRLIVGLCPYMFLPDSAFIHRLHGWIMKISGSYPTP